MNRTPTERITQYMRRLSRLKQERASWLSGWKEIATYIYPWLLRRLDDRALRQFEGKTPSLLNSTPAWAVNVLASGLSSGMAPQSRKWFRLALPNDAEMQHEQKTKQWLHDVEETISAALHRSNAYDVLPTLFLSLSLFGTAVLFVDSDDEDGIRFYSPPNGTYMIANSGRQNVDTFYREIRFTTSELVDRFGLENVSTTVRQRYEKGDYDTLVDVIQVIEPSPEADYEALAAVDSAPYRGVFFERMQGGGESKFLSENGFYELPIMAARWELYDGDVYGYGPGHKALGDCKALKRNMLTQAYLAEQLVEPAIYAPSYLNKVGGVRIKPGEVTYYEPSWGPPQLGPLLPINPTALTVLAQQEDAIKQRILQAFFVDVFLAVSQTPAKSGVTATEILERYQEKLLMLGPVLERVNNDLLDPMIKRVFGVLARSGHIPEPPEEIANITPNIEYISAVALGQQATTVTAIEALAGFLGNVAAVFPDALDLLDTDTAVRTYASLHDLPPNILRESSTVNRIRGDREQQSQTAQQAETSAQLVNAAKVLSETNTRDSNLLTNTMDAMGYMTGLGL